MSIEKVREYMEQYGKRQEIREFSESSATVELAAHAVGVEPARIAKTLSFCGKEAGTCVLVVTAGDQKVDNSKFKHYFGMKAKMPKGEEVEALTPLDYLRRCEEIEVRSVAVENRLVTGSHQITVMADLLIDEVDLSEIEMIILPGGMPGTLNLEKSEKLQKIIAEVMNVDEEEITMDTTFVDDLGADSLDVYQIIMGIEEEFDIEIPNEEAEKIVSVGDAVEAIKNAIDA